MIGATQLRLDGEADEIGRPEDDHYQTPMWLVDAILDVATTWSFCRPSVLDAGAGDGRLGLACQSRWSPAGRLTLVELTPGRLPPASAPIEPIETNFLTWSAATDRRFDVVISDPPFRLWDEFTRAILPLVAPGGTALVLGFVNVLGGQGRAAWWRAHPPSRIWLSPQRPSFTPDGETDRRDAAWFEWSPHPRRAEVRWLNTERA